VPSLSLASENTNSGTQLSLVGTKKETTWLLVALDGTPAEGTADRDYGARLSYQPLLKPNAPNHGFFYRPKYPDISDISCLSIGADKK
jgi:hypothetical protein